MHEAFYGKYNGIFRVYVNSVYQASPRGEWPGDEATSCPVVCLLIGIIELSNCMHPIYVQLAHV